MYPKLSAYLKSTEIQIKKNDFPIKEEIVEEIYEDPVLEALKEKKISEIAAIYLSK